MPHCNLDWKNQDWRAVVLAIGVFRQSRASTGFYCSCNVQYVSVAMTIVLRFVLVSGSLFNCLTDHRCSFTCTSVLERQGGLSEARSCDAWILMVVWAQFWVRES